jgi:hypothetical protein
MSSPADVSHKVRQLDNDVQATYDMISTVQSTQMRHTNRFAQGQSDPRAAAPLTQPKFFPSPR